ncbi:MAG: hypothetical protein C4K47_00865 [Candidatus Thorarchaeota archaeon]|nr:MAG: hypothetical protein C4K47_00865 [Candidatus Thorarchaeota archaeon]
MQDFFQIITQLILQGYLGLLLACFIINMIPFLSPSNMVLAGVAAVLMPSMVWLAIGVIVAVAATLAKTVHYGIVRFSRKAMSERLLKSVDLEKARAEKWGGLALFLAAASPFPDDPVVVYTALTRYSIVKFILTYFAGKVTVTSAGALIGYVAGGLLEGAPVILASLVLTALIMGFLLKRRYDSKEDKSGDSHNS